MTDLKNVMSLKERIVTWTSYSEIRNDNLGDSNVDS